MQAGRLRDKVSFEREVRSPDGGGGYDLSWAPLVTAFGQLSMERSRERVEAGRIEAPATGTLVVRYQSALADLSAGDRVLINGEAYNIKSEPTNPDRRLRMLEMTVERGVAV